MLNRYLRRELRASYGRRPARKRDIPRHTEELVTERDESTDAEAISACISPLAHLSLSSRSWQQESEETEGLFCKR